MNGPWDSSQGQYGLIPIEDVDVNRRAALRRHAPRTCGHWASPRSINRIAVLLHPLPHFRQALHELRLDLATRHRPHIQEKIRIQSGGAHEVANQICWALVVFVGEIESPRVVHSFRGFEWQRADRLLRVETSGVLAGQIFFKHLEVLAGKRSLMMIASDERLRLELMNQAVGAGEMPIRVRLVPHSVEPDAADLSVIRQQLTQLPVHEIQVGVPVPGIRAARTMPGAPAGKIIGRMPIQLGVVQEQLDALFMAFGR